jgi:hypothetical protein
MIWSTIQQFVNIRNLEILMGILMGVDFLRRLLKSADSSSSDISSISSTDIIYPSCSDLKVLYSLALEGKEIELNDRLISIVEQQPNLSSFAQRLHPLIEESQVEGYVNFLEQAIANFPKV